jgi:hypothetical protein
MVTNVTSHGRTHHDTVRIMKDRREDKRLPMNQ